MIKLPLQYCGGKDDVFSKMMLRKLDTGWRGDTDPPPTSLLVKINSIYLIDLNMKGIGR